MLAMESLSSAAVVVEERHAHGKVARLFFQHLVIFLKGLVRLPVLQQPVAHHHAVVEVVRILVGQFLQLVELFFLLAHLLIDVHAARANLLAGAVDVLNAVERG